MNEKDEEIHIEDIIAGMKKFLNRFFHMHDWSKWEIVRESYTYFDTRRQCKSCGKFQAETKWY